MYLEPPRPRKKFVLSLVMGVGVLHPPPPPGPSLGLEQALGLDPPDRPDVVIFGNFYQIQDMYHAATGRGTVSWQATGRLTRYSGVGWGGGGGRGGWVTQAQWPSGAGSYPTSPMQITASLFLREHE